VANNSAADRATIVRVLGAFVRHHAPWPVGASNGPQHPIPELDESLPWLTYRLPDVDIALHVLARRQGSPLDPQLLLSRVDLRGLILNRVTGLGFSQAVIRRANLARAWLPGARLDRCDLTGTDLRRANLQRARLIGAVLRGAYLQDAKLDEADLRNADLRGANLSGSRLDGADLTGAREDPATVWPEGCDADWRVRAGIVMSAQTGDSLDPVGSA
jgi:Pentapeptide repeats (8 copies)